MLSRLDGFGVDITKEFVVILCYLLMMMVYFMTSTSRASRGALDNVEEEPISITRRDSSS